MRWWLVSFRTVPFFSACSGFHVVAHEAMHASMGCVAFCSQAASCGLLYVEIVERLTPARHLRIAESYASLHASAHAAHASASGVSTHRRFVTKHPFWHSVMAGTSDAGNDHEQSSSHLSKASAQLMHLNWRSCPCTKYAKKQHSRWCREIMMGDRGGGKTK